MGFLDHSTNNIILDAVLTDVGRQFLSRNDGSFSIVKFATGDDEVNYNVIKKYGRTVGREKIEKNTPVFEGLTNQAHAQKYKLISISNPNLVRLPNFALTGDINSSTDTVTLTNVLTSNSSGNTGNTVGKQATITVSQNIVNENSIDVELRDQTFIVEMSNLFLQIVGNTPENVDGQQRSTYILTRQATSNSLGGSQLQFTIQVKSLTTALFTVYGSGASRNTINTYVKVTGLQSGAVKEFKVSLTK